MMRNLFQSLLVLLARVATPELSRVIDDLQGKLQFQSVEIRMMRARLPKRIVLTRRERRRLIQFGLPLGPAIKHLITIVTPRTFARWLNDSGAKRIDEPPPTGRPRTDAEIRDLVLRLASENSWGYSRIHGELKKLGVRNVSRTTVANILRENGFDPGPKRGHATWDEFVKRHVSTLWACDFFSKKIWTTGGFIEYFVLFFIHIGSRRVHIAGMTTHPNHVWMAQQARNLSMFFDEQAVQPRFLIRDHDGKFGDKFDAILESEGIEILPVGPHAPNLNAHAERWVLSLKSECLDHFVVFGEDHLRHILREYETHYNEERPHQGLGNAPLAPAQPPPDDTNGPIICHERLGGLLKHYRRAS